MPDLLTTAHAHAQRGWRVFPLRPDDKRPAVKDWENRATLDPDRINRCWTTGPYGIGIACGPSGLVVVDLDVPKSNTDTPPGEWAAACDGLDVFTTLAGRHGAGIDATYTVSTGRGGTHLYYRHPDTGPDLRNTAGTLGPMVDTRAHGGYVVAAGSTVNGRPYTVALDVDPAPLPDWLTTLLQPAPLPPQQPVVVDLGTGRRAAYLDTAIRNQVTEVTTATPGSRNQALYRSAVALGQLAAGGAITDTTATAVLTDAGQRAGLGQVETARTIASGLRAGARRPRTVAA
nr:bifunctional DNA primase/polymerase [Micromonospora sp. DSM 115978]